MLKLGVTDRKAEELASRMERCGLVESDMKESFVRSSGPGGQRVNKTSSCVYLRHEPTGLEVKMQKSRDQRLNRFYARRRMCELLEEMVLGEKSPEALKQEKIRKQKQRRKRRGRGKEKPTIDEGKSADDANL
ncbi:MAG: peptide chain release factor-like protein [Sedimentisphaerales bacterium]|nr:peptide chain release factor-like protein [Sedimentisphaerales bacterium]